MDFDKVIHGRYSCKSYDGRPVAKEQLDAILEAGRLAPTAKNLQEQRVYVMQSAEALAMIDKVTPCRYNAGTALVVAYDKTNVYTYPGGKYSSGAEDAAIVATSMMYAATAVGVDNCWVNCFDPDALAKDMKLPENEEILMILDLGYAAPGTEPKPPHFQRKELDQTVRYV